MSRRRPGSLTTWRVLPDESIPTPRRPNKSVLSVELDLSLAAMPTVYVTRTERFNAAHRLHNPERSDAWNEDMFGKCNNPNWHGHNYTLEVTVAGEPDPETGYVIDLSTLKQILHERVIDKVDHRNLNRDVDFMAGVMPSTENFVVGIWKELEGALPSGRLHRIRLYETEHNMAEYRGE